MVSVGIKKHPLERLGLPAPCEGTWWREVAVSWMCCHRQFMVLSLFLEQSSNFYRDDNPDLEVENGYCASLGRRVGWLGQPFISI